MNLVKLFLVFTFLLASVFPVMWSPISMGGVLILISMSLVVLIGLMFSSWYAFVLFLVYIGGLLVLFIYVCMVSSNYSMSVKTQGVIMGFLVGALISSKIDYTLSGQFLGGDTYSSGSLMVSDPLIPLFIGLVVFLLFVFLAIVRVITTGGALVIESK
uniref:NADH dehydrogenase subunit 6 n=1 Tax=Salinator rhamphidia TaxID=981055 RepID=G8HR46_9GAST|nr:NADH dehydrogenase subunit 6 [Salinator rhamphidia]AEQ93892.1 NADH dehydrogenase subunit 6 [Salinator rhamphidia]